MSQTKKNIEKNTRGGMHREGKVILTRETAEEGAKKKTWPAYKQIDMDNGITGQQRWFGFEGLQFGGKGRQKSQPGWLWMGEFWGWVCTREKTKRRGETSSIRLEDREGVSDKKKELGEPSSSSSYQEAE